MMMQTVLATTLALAQAPAASGAAPVPPLEEAKERIAALDSTMFWYAFEGCDADEVRTRITDDLRMVHDLGGIVADSGDAFAAIIRSNCADREPGGKNAGYKNRRLLVPGSDSVTPLGQWGVLHRGLHTFHEWRGEEAGWVQVGGARFLNLWQWMPDEGTFRLQETISIDHAPAAPYPPEG